jgi:hypothetical protein
MVVEYYGLTERESEKIHEDIAEAIECLHNAIVLEVGPEMAKWIEKTLLVEAERRGSENNRELHESLMWHKGRRSIKK